MRKSWLAAAAGAAALSLVGAPALAGNATDKATGGGQFLISSDGAKLSTIGFTAQETAGVAKGQVQVIDRDAGTGQSQVKFHGTVDCVVVRTKTAYISGLGSDGATPFQLTVQDNGEGANATDADMILFQQGDNAQHNSDYASTCGVNTNNKGVALAHGNVQVTNGDSSNDS